MPKSVIIYPNEILITSLGVDGLRLIIFNSLLAFTRRKNLVLRTSKDQALDWLASQ